MNSGQCQFLTMSVLYMVILAIANNVLCGCSNSTSKSVTSSSSVSDLLAKLPNLNNLGVESCTYTIEKSSSSGGLPSPSDMRLELKGSAVLSDDGFKTLQSSFDWKSTRRKDIPKTLFTSLPQGDVDVLVSQKLNESFADNQSYVHGFVVILGGNSMNRVYFIATDKDHPIK